MDQEELAKAQLISDPWASAENVEPPNKEQAKVLLAEALRFADDQVRRHLHAWSVAGVGGAVVAEQIEVFLILEGLIEIATDAARDLDIRPMQRPWTPQEIADWEAGNYATQPPSWEIEWAEADRVAQLWAQCASTRLRQHTSGRRRLEDDPESDWREIAERAFELRRRRPGLKRPQIATQVGVSESTLKKYLALVRRMVRAGTDSPLTDKT